MGGNGEQVYSRLPVLRAERGLSRHDVAAAVGVHYQTIGYLNAASTAPACSSLSSSQPISTCR